MPHWSRNDCAIRRAFCREMLESFWEDGAGEGGRPVLKLPEGVRLTAQANAAIEALGGADYVNYRLRVLTNFGFPVGHAILSDRLRRMPCYGIEDFLRIEGREYLRGIGPAVVALPHTGPIGALLMPALRRCTDAAVAFIGDDYHPWTPDVRTLRASSPLVAAAALQTLQASGMVVWFPDSRHAPRSRRRTDVEFLGRRREVDVTMAAIVKRAGARMLVGALWLEDPPYDGARFALDEPVPRDEMRTLSDEELTQRLYSEVDHQLTLHLDQWTSWQFREVWPLRENDTVGVSDD